MKTASPTPDWNDSFAGMLSAMSLAGLFAMLAWALVSL